MAIDWEPKLSELRAAISALADQGPADLLKKEGEDVAERLKGAGELYDKQTSPVPATDDSLSTVVAELDAVAALVDGNPASPSTFAAAQARLTAALSGANETETALINRALAVQEPGDDVAKQSSNVKKGTEVEYRPWNHGSGRHVTVTTYYTRGELEDALLAAIEQAGQWLTLAGGA